MQSISDCTELKTLFERKAVIPRCTKSCNSCENPGAVRKYATAVGFLREFAHAFFLQGVFFGIISPIG